jgi:PAP2 superfamily
MPKMMRAATLAAIVSIAAAPALAADAVSFWNETAITTSAVHLGRAPAASPVDLAYMHAAIYDVVVALRGGYGPFAVTVTDAPAGASIDAAIAAAAHRVLVTMFPGDQAYIDGRYALALSGIADGPSRSDGVALGEQIAQGLLSARSGDGWNAAFSYVPGSGPGVWQPTPPAFAPASTPWLSVMRPFTFDNPAQFRADPPPLLTSALWAEDYNEVQSVGSATSVTRTPAQTEIARFYGEHAGIQYARIFRDLAAEKGLSLEQSARLFAMLYVTSADAIIGCWDSKYHYSFWRPVTAIRAGDTDDNAATMPDSQWLPLLTTPAHPEYPSAHGCFTASVAEALATFFGTKKVAITLTSTFPGSGSPRTFESTDDLIHEVIDARVYAGIHYRTSVVRGTVLGRRVAQWVSKRYFQPVE